MPEPRHMLLEIIDINLIQVEFVTSGLAGKLESYASKIWILLHFVLFHIVMALIIEQQKTHSKRQRKTEKRENNREVISK